MEFFIPSIILFLIAMVISFAVAPNLSPIILAILSITLLVFGVYHHYNMFASEYRLSTWQESLKIYAPAIMIGAIIIFIIYSIFGFFSTGSVPVPQIPKVEIPEIPDMNKVSNAISNHVSNAVNTVSNHVGNITNVVSNKVNALTNQNKNKGNQNNKNKNNVSRSLLEVL